MQDQRNGRARGLGRAVFAFKAAGRAGNDNVGHGRITGPAAISLALHSGIDFQVVQGVWENQVLILDSRAWDISSL